MGALSLDGRVAIITGGGRGIGAATAELFLSQGAKVIISSRSENELKGLELKHASKNLFSVPADVSDEASVIRLFDLSLQKFGKVDILINNAGIFSSGFLKDLTTDAWDQILDINLRGSFLCAREAFRRMKPGSSIVNISSIAGVRGSTKFPGFGAYVVSKFGVVGLTEALAVEGRELGIRVNCVAPGAINTKMLRDAFPDFSGGGRPEDLAGVILGVVDENRSSLLTGAVIEVVTEKI